MPEIFGGDVAYFELAMRRFVFLTVLAYPERSSPANYAARACRPCASDRASPELICRTPGRVLRSRLWFRRLRVRPAARRRDGVRMSTKKSKLPRKPRQRLCENRIA